jgi:hypothetical protein
LGAQSQNVIVGPPFVISPLPLTCLCT